MIKGGMYFLIFQPKDMLNLCLNLNESQPICAYKHLKKSVLKIL